MERSKFSRRALWYGIFHPANRRLNLCALVLAGLGVLFASLSGIASFHVLTALALLALVGLVVFHVQHFRQMEALAMRRQLENWVKDAPTQSQRATRQAAFDTQPLGALWALSGLTAAGLAVNLSPGMMTPGANAGMAGLGGDDGLVMGGFNEHTGRYLDASAAHESSLDDAHPEYTGPLVNTDGTPMQEGGMVDIMGSAYGTSHDSFDSTRWD